MRLYVGLTYTKAQITSGIPTSVYIGPSRSACIAAIQTPVDAGTASKGTLLNNLHPDNLPRRKNPAGT